MSSRLRFSKFTAGDPLFLVNQALAIIPVRRSSNTQANLTIGGNWILNLLEGAGIPTALRGSSPGDNVKIAFQGTTFGLIYQQTSSGGQISIAIDGVTLVTSLDTYNSVNLTEQQTIVSTALLDASHTAVITILSSKNSASSGNNFNLQGWMVDSSSNTLPAIEVTNVRSVLFTPNMQWRALSTGIIKIADAAGMVGLVGWDYGSPAAGQRVKTNSSGRLEVIPIAAGTTSLTASAPTFATVGVASAQAVASNTSRTGLVLVNTSANNISLGLGATAVLNSGITLMPNGGTWVMDAYTFTTATINAIAGAASSNLAIQEYT